MPDLPVILIGAGDHARVLIDTLHLLGRRLLFATDHNAAMHGKTMSGLLIKGDDGCVFEHPPESVVLVNAVGSVARPTARQHVFETFHARGYRFERVIHPTAILAPSVELGEGAQVMAGVVVQPGARIGPNVLLNTRSCIDHDCIIGAHVHIAPGVTLSGSVRVHDMVHIGTGAIVIQRIDIGRGAVVGAGGVVVRDAPPHTLVMGVPARPQRNLAPAPDGRVARVMISASGRRVVLMKLFEQSIQRLGLDADVLATDINRLSSAYHQAHHTGLVPRYSQPDCLPRLLELCERERVKLIVPTIDPDLDFYTAHFDDFAARGIEVLLSGAEAVHRSNDKQATHDWLTSAGFPTVRQGSLDEVLGAPAGEWEYPIFVKPRFGSSSVGAQRIDQRGQLEQLPRNVPYIVQSLAVGNEYTVDVYVDDDGRCRCAVPRLRLETRGGEVSKGMTCREEPVQALARRVSEALPGARGVLNIQIFYDHRTGTLQVIEINPRFGGGYPLAHTAGAPMTQWVLERCFGLPSTANDEQWRDGLVMLRYDEAVYVSRQEAGINRFGDPISPAPTPP